VIEEINKLKSDLKEVKEENNKLKKNLIEVDEKMKKEKEEKDEEINKLKSDLKEMKEEINELKKSLTEEVGKKMKKEIYKISKIAWGDFIGEGFEIENGVLGLERDIYLSIVKFLDSSILRKV
jgi:predicted RNase H-like nuclease (RuvC/YqgF family)